MTLECSSDELLVRVAFMHREDSICQYNASIQPHSPGKYLAGAALVHHADPSGVSQPCRFGMMHECFNWQPRLHSCIMTI